MWGLLDRILGTHCRIRSNLESGLSATRSVTIDRLAPPGLAAECDDAGRFAGGGFTYLDIAGLLTSRLGLCDLERSLGQAEPVAGDRDDWDRNLGRAEGDEQRGEVLGGRV